MFRWMSYGNDPKATHASNEKDFFFRREWSFTLAGTRILSQLLWLAVRHIKRRR